MLAVEIEGEGKVEEELLLLERIASLEAQLQRLMVVKIVRSTYVELVCEASARAVAEVERIEDRRHTHRSLPFRSEILLHLVHQTASHSPPDAV